MFFWASAEVHKPATEGLERTRRSVEPWLNDAFEKSSLVKLQIKLRYVPIVMPKAMHAKYTERSKALVKQKIYDCAPHLDYETFVSGTFEEQVREYIRGAALSGPHLRKFGATAEQTADFERIMEEAPAQIVLLEPGVVRH